MRLLTFSTLYPSSVRPGHGIFVETRLRYLLASGSAQSVVVAPIPWVPLSHSGFGRYRVLARTARQEMLHGIEVLHPRYPLLPKIGMSTAPFLLAGACARSLRKVLERGYQFDVIDAHYFYPTGVAAMLLGRHFGKPVVITARGSDINLIAQHAIPRRLIMWAARRAAAVVAVSQALRRSLEELGVDRAKICVLRNGVDLDVFRPLDRDAERARLGVGGRLLLSVGNLVELKGNEFAIGSLKSLPEATLFLIGDGPDRCRLESIARKTGVAERVRFIGAVVQTDLPRYYSAADALVLASSREGWPNVLLEAMACGTPVVAARIGGTPEVVTSPAAGVLFEPRTAEALGRAIRELLESPPRRDDTRRHAETFSWDETTRGQLALFRSIVGSRGRVEGQASSTPKQR
jgi:teichuronic acid biosynthesis glycosyltransferase TuaC